MKFIDVNVQNKIAQCADVNAFIVCSNSDYVINFKFDEEWDEHLVKTARFIFNGSVIDVVFEGNSVNVPIIYKSTVMTVGVFAGQLHTTTPAIIPCQKSILCDEGFVPDPPPDVYAQILEKLDEVLNNSGGGSGGENGVTFIPSISPDGVLSWTNDGGLPNPPPIKIKGEPGEDGHTPERGTDYWTNEDIAEIKGYVDDAILGGAW